MIYHILNGDGLAGNFSLEGEKIICRECLIEGKLKAKNLDELWAARANFVKKTFGDDSYFEKVKSEFKKIEKIKPNDQVNLWFGNEAFCQVNMWLFLNLLEAKAAIIYRVFPDSDNWDCSFNDLEKCFDNRQLLTENDLQLGNKLWKAYCFQDFETLKNLSNTQSENLPQLKEVCHAIIEKDTKPTEILREILSSGETDFNKIFLQFREKAGIYGFGDSQVKNILNSI